MKNKAFIFTVFGCIGVVTTAIAAIKESKKTCKRLDRIIGEKDVESPDSTSKKIFRIARDYKFTLLSGALTVGSIILSYRESAKVIGGLTATAAGAILNKEQILKAVREHTDEKTAREIEIDALLRAQKFLPIRSIEDTGYGNEICCFMFGSRWFLSSEQAIREQLAMFNEDLIADNKRSEYGACRSLSDVFAALNMFPDDLGDTFGWDTDLFDEDEGIPFIIERVTTWLDELGNKHNCNILTVRIDTIRGNTPEPYFMGC